MNGKVFAPTFVMASVQRMCLVKLLIIICLAFTPVMSKCALAQIPEHDITVGRTIHTNKPVCLVYRHDGFWVTQAVTEDTLRHYSMDGTLLAEYQLPGSVQRYGVAWDGTHWWIGDNNYGSETIYKCELNEAEKRLEPVRAYDWPYLGPSGLEWAQGYLWVSDDSTDIIYRVSVGDTSFTAIEDWCSTNPEPWDLAWDGTNIWSITGPGGGFDPVHGEREIYKHDAAGNIIEIWHYPPADDPGQGSYGGCGTGLAFAGSQLWYCDHDRNEIIEGIRGPEPTEPPTADAGDDIVADANEKVILDGSGSSDPDGQIIKYTWKRLPDDMVIYSGKEPTCQTKALGRVEEVIELTVTDNSLATAADTVKIINRTTQDLKDQLATMQSQIEQLRQQNQQQQDLLDRICAWPPIKQWLRRAIRLGDLNNDGAVNMSDFALLAKDWLH